jgi:UDP-N-acetyl-D-glucosamine dehydrogenase
MSKVSIIGLGYVGLPLALLTAKKGHEVIGIDLDKNKVKRINDRIDPLRDEYVSRSIVNSSLKASTDISKISDCDLNIVCVPTPIKNDYQPDLVPLKNAVSAIAPNIKRGSVLVIESTINPGVCEEIIIPIVEKLSDMKVNDGFHVSHCPERINPGDKNWNVENIPRVLGSSDPKGLELTVQFYESIIDAPIKPMDSIKEAEACKVVENSFRDINIAFVNELAKSFTKLGINVKNVIDGAATKPFAFMPHYPSIGVGGHCIPVDPYYLIEYARGYGFEHEFLALARSINNSMPEFTVEQLMDGLNEAGLTIKGSRVALLGLSYKANVSDDRESPSYKVKNLLEDKGARVITYDPYILDKSSVKSFPEALENADAVIIATNHAEFMKMDFTATRLKVIVDGKNCLPYEKIRKSGIIYRGIGVR